MEKAVKLIKKYDELMSEYPGRWVAICDDEVVATAESAEELMDKITGLDDVFVGYSPTPEEKRVGYLLPFEGAF